MKPIAVITGDIIASKRLKNRARLTPLLKESFDLINRNILGRSGRFEIYRGDSFQAIIPDAEKALAVSVLIRSRLRQWNFKSSKKAKGKNASTGAKPFPDARIGIGIGHISYRGRKIVESDGEAFQHSGAMLDLLKPTERALGIRTPWQDVNEEFAVSTQLADVIISRWSPASAEAIFLHLLGGKTQEKLSRTLGISQPAVHKRLSSGHVTEIENYLARFNAIVQQKINR